MSRYVCVCVCVCLHVCVKATGIQHAFISILRCVVQSFLNGFVHVCVCLCVYVCVTISIRVGPSEAFL